MTIALNIILLLVGFALLIKGADFFVEGAAGIAVRFGIPQIIIGLTIVAFGTSLPEAAISISAAVKGTNGIAIGNVLGSNIMNILLILGITACIITLKVQESTWKVEIPYMLLITVALVVLGNAMHVLNFACGLILWTFMILFLVYLVVAARKGMSENELYEMEEVAEETETAGRPTETA